LVCPALGGTGDGTFVFQSSLNRSVEYRRERQKSLKGGVAKSYLPEKNRVLLYFARIQYQARRSD